jgi:hypothetical protein
MELCFPPGTEFENFMQGVSMELPVFPPEGKGDLKFSRGDNSMKPCNLHIIKTLRLVEEMMELADRGDTDREDNGCGILYGVLRDSAYKLKKLAEEEKQNHMTKGWWQEQP